MIGRTERVGWRAGELLSASDFSGSVLAVVSNAVYLRGEDGEITWLGQRELPMHSRALHGHFDFGGLKVGLTFRRDGEYLRFGEGAETLHTMSLHFATAKAWQPAAIESGQLASRELVSARAKQLRDAVGERSDPVIDYFADAYAKKTHPVAEACRAHDMSRVLELGRDLIGLGPGLTPSGDDFLGGLLFAAYQLNVAYPGTFEWEVTAIDDLLDWARSRTNAISHAILCDHAQGQGVAPLHDLIAALLRGKPADEVVRHARRVIAVGSTSGREMLAGAMEGMRLAE